MGWIRVDENAPYHRKLLSAGPAAAWLWVCGLAYCQRMKSDGFIPVEALPQLGVGNYKKLVGFLVSARLWHKTDGGYTVHDYLDWNATKDEREDQARRKQERQDRWKAKRDASTDDDGDAAKTRLHSGDEDASLLRSGDGAISITESKDPPIAPHGGETPPSPSALDQRFEAWWLVYPKAGRVGKGSALKKWRKLKPSNELLDQMIAAVRAQERTRKWQEGFIPHATTWLNQGRWMDDVEESTGGAGPQYTRWDQCKTCGDAHPINQPCVPQEAR